MMLTFVKYICLIDLVTIPLSVEQMSVTYYEKVSTLRVEFWNDGLPVGVDWVVRIDLHSVAHCTAA